MLKILNNEEEYKTKLKDLEPVLQLTAHEEGLPYMPLIPTLRAYGLSVFDWWLFRAAYLDSLERSIEDNVNYVVI